jgi:hypothetical protein
LRVTIEERRKPVPSLSGTKVRKWVVSIQAPFRRITVFKEKSNHK